MMFSLSLATKTVQVVKFCEAIVVLSGVILFNITNIVEQENILENNDFG